MQITIVQTEIEQAIQEYIKSHVNIRDGHIITVDLTATRGEAGFKAVIDITNDAVIHSAVPTEPIKRTPDVALLSHNAEVQQVVSLPQPKTATEMRQALEAQYEEEAKKETEAKAEAVVASTAEAVAEATVEETAPVVTTPSETAKPRSLFGNLRRPVNMGPIGSSLAVNT